MIRAVALSRRDLWGIRLHYFFWIGGGGFLLPFLGLFFRRQGLSGTQIGLLSTIGAVSALLAAPLWGRWSDGAARPRRILQTALLATALSTVWLSQQRVFAWMAVVGCVRALVSAGVEPLSDTLALGLTHGGSRRGFGSVRLWGSLGWAVIVLLAGWLIERTSLLSAFVGHATALGTSALFLNLINTGAQPAQRATRTPRHSTQSLVRSLLHDPSMVSLGAALVIVWLSSNGLHQFEAIFLDELGAGESLIGLSSTLSALIELPAMLWADRLVHRYGSGRLLRTALAIEAAMRSLVLLSPTVPAIVAGRAASGIAFSFYSVATVVFISKRAPAQQSTTALALYTVTLRSLIQIVGAPLSGLAFDVFGAYSLYAIALGGSVLGWLALRFAAANHDSQSRANL